jgi:hypothetical protein
VKFICKDFDVSKQEDFVTIPLFLVNNFFRLGDRPQDSHLNTAIARPFIMLDLDWFADPRLHSLR